MWVHVCCNMLTFQGRVTHIVYASVNYAAIHKAACHLITTKPSSEPILAYYWLDLWDKGQWSSNQIDKFYNMKINSKLSSAKWWSFCLWINVFKSHCKTGLRPHPPTRQIPIEPGDSIITNMTLIRYHAPLQPTRYPRARQFDYRITQILLSEISMEPSWKPTIGSNMNRN